MWLRVISATDLDDDEACPRVVGGRKVDAGLPVGDVKALHGGLDGSGKG